MPQVRRSGITAGIALAGASLIAVTPAAAPGPDVQHRSIRLVDVDHGVIPFPEVDYNDLVANTTANFNGLMDMYDQTTALYSLPDAVYSQGLTQVFTDLSTDVQELAKYSAALSAYDAAVAAQNGELDPTGTLPPIPTFPDLHNDPVLNPVSALTLLVQNGLASGFGSNAAEVGWTGIYQNMLPSINDISAQTHSIFTELGNEFTGGTFSTSTIQTDLTAIGTDFTTIENFLSLAPTTILNDYLNGYPVESSAPDPLASVVPSVGDAYTLNAPYTADDNVSLTPEFGLLSNPFAAFTTDTSGFGDGPSSSFLGTAPLETGTLASLLQTEQTLSDELLTVTSTVPGSGVTAPDPTGVLTILGPDKLDFTLNLSQIPVIGSLIDYINTTVTPALNGALTTVIETTNTLIGTVNDGVDALSSLLTDTVNPFIDLANAFASIIGESISPVTVDIPNIPTIPLSDIPSIPSIPTLIGDTFNLPGITEPGVPAYVMDLANNEMAILGSFASIAAPVTGTVSSEGIGNFLATDAFMNLGTLFDSTLASIFADTPLTFTSTLPLDWTNLVAESLQNLFTA